MDCNASCPKNILPFFPAPNYSSAMPEQSAPRRPALQRRQFLKRALLAGMGGLVPARAWLARGADSVTMPFANGTRSLVTFPQKRPLILLTTRPPQLETPFSVFNKGVLTPNDAFFVRYHLSQVPTSIDPASFTLTVNGSVNSPLTLSLQELKSKFEIVELVAVNQCSGNGRGFFSPRVAGSQMGNGAMGNARWKGVRLRQVLQKAGLSADSRQVTFDGLDSPVVQKTPDFVKALDVEQALEEDTMLAYEMNGQALPVLNGFPLRLVVPGYYGTYWVKHLNQITVLREPFSGYWMDTAYRIPDNACSCVEPGATAKRTKPIARYNVRSFITNLADGDKLVVKSEAVVRGIAFDGGYGIAEVLFSADDGKTWREAQLGRDMGKYSFREWSIPFTPDRAGA